MYKSLLSHYKVEFEILKSFLGYIPRLTIELLEQLLSNCGLII
jgi:hypothetical protein